LWRKTLGSTQQSGRVNLSRLENSPTGGRVKQRFQICRSMEVAVAKKGQLEGDILVGYAARIKDELGRPSLHGSTEQRGDLRGGEPASLSRDVDLEALELGGMGLCEKLAELIWFDAAEDHHGKVGPEARPPFGDDA
jgi:hypothetical protein